MKTTREAGGRSLDIAGPTPSRTYVWIPSIKTVVGGVVLFSSGFAETGLPEHFLADKPPEPPEGQRQGEVGLASRRFGASSATGTPSSRKPGPIQRGI